MSEKSLRGATPGVDQAAASGVPAASSPPGAAGGGRSADTGGAPVEPWGGERTERVGSRENSAPRVALVPSVTADGEVDTQANVQASTGDTRRVTDSGRTTLMGVPSPVAAQTDKPTTSPGHDVHLPAEKGRVADARPAAGGVIPAVELDPSSTRRIGKIDPPGKPTGEPKRGSKDDSAEKSARKDSTAGGAVLNERTMAAAAATFRASAATGDQPSADDQAGDQEQQRGWTADRTQEFRLDVPPPKSVFAKALATGMALAVGTGILVVSFVHSRVRGAAESTEAHANAPLPVAPVPLPPPPPPENPVPPAVVDPANGQPNEAANVVAPAVPEVPGADPAAAAQPAIGIADEPDGGKTERRTAQRGKAPPLAGRPSAPARAPRPAPTLVKPTPPSLPGGPAPTPAPVAATPTAPPPLTAAPPPEKPPVAKPETAKPYDPDMPLPPSTE